MVVSSQGMEIDTFTKTSGGNDVVATEPNSNFRQAQTPKHCNKGNSIRPQGNGVSNFQPQAYPGYPQGPNSYRSGLYNPNSRGPSRASSYYPHPSVMVSPGGGGYMRPPGPYYAGNEYEHHGYPPQYQNHRYQQPPMYGSDMHNRPPYDPRSQQQNGYNNQPPPPPPQQQQQKQQPQPQPGMDFSRAVSSSFGETNSKSSADKLRNEKESSDSLPRFPNFYKNDDDRSIASKADSDTSWKLLNQVASIEEEKYRNAESNNRLNTTSPIGGRSSTERKKGPSEPTPSKMGPLTSLSSVASIQEPLDTSNSKDELDLIQCASSGSLLFNTHEDSFTKRPREDRGDADDSMRGRGDDEIRKAPSTSPPNVANLTVKEENDTSVRPPKRKRSTNEFYDNPPSYSFSLESASSFTKDQQFTALPLPTEKPRASSYLDPFDNQKDKNDSNRDEMLPSSNLLWEIKGQDSFGGALSVGSNISAQHGDGPVITSSFSFGKDSQNEADMNNVEPIEEAKLPVYKENNSLYGGTKMDKGSTDGSGNGNSERSTNKPMLGPQFPPPSASWVSNASSFTRDPSEMHASRQPGSRMYAPGHPMPVRSFSSNSSIPSQRHLQGQKHPAQHPHEMMRNFSHDSGRSSPTMHSMSRYGPLHGPYGAPLPPHMPQSDAHLPPSFRPPPPPHMQNHGHMGRRPPQAVYIMSSPSGGRQGMTRHASTDSTVSKATGGVYSWTKQDDGRLTDIMKKFKNPKDWEPIAKEFGRGKTAKECHERWIRYLKPGVRKGQWQDHEDAIVVEAVTTSKEQPFTRWSDLAQRLPGRVGKQIRDRWVNHLNPNINHMPFTRDDDLLLWDGHKKLGKRWVEISSKYFNSSRSENHIKNRWYSASFKKFIANEFGPDAYNGGKKKDSKGAGKGVSAKV